MKMNKADSIRKKIYIYYPFLISSALLFLLCTGYNYSVRLGLFPDEIAHLGFVLDVVRKGFPDYRHGIMFESIKLNYLEHPSLYYLITGWYAKFILHFHDFSYKTFRLVNYIFSILTLFFVFKALNLMKISKGAILFAFFPVLCIPMFIMLSASVNNDPLMILGCAIVFYAFVILYFEPQEEKNKHNDFIVFLLLGCVITALTKATGALSIICMLISFILVDFVKFKSIVCKLNKRNIYLTLIALAAVIIYYGLTWYHYGKFFPSPQSNPSIWFQQGHPEARRMGILEHLSAFYTSNLLTLLIPYGHKDFIDTLYREKLESVVLISLPVFLILASIWSCKNNKNTFKFICFATLSFAMYMVFYFYTIHKLHMATGYPGAMQSRYFYGFLPFWICIYAITFNIIKNAFIKGLIYLVLTVALISSFYPSWAPLFLPYYGQEKFNTTYGELTRGNYFEQSFTAQSTKLNKVEISIGTYQRVNKGILTLSLLTMDHKIIANKSTNMSLLRDNSWVAFNFDSIPLSKGTGYILKLTSEESEPGNAITWWALSNFKELPQYAGTDLGPASPEGNRYLEGLASIDGKRIDGTFSFRIFR